MILSLLLLAIAFAGSLWGCGIARAWLERRAILDLPNERSSHAVPTPRGGGLAVIPAILLPWALLSALGRAAPGIWVAILAALGLAALSWLDDKGGLGRRLRLACHAAAVATGLAALPHDLLVFQGLLPFWLDRLLTGIAWVWLVNLTNFMDGIDGITGIECLAVCLGLAWVARAMGGDFALPALVVAAASLAFLYWNWSPARLFMGDVGSVPLGFLLGWLLIDAAEHGAWAAALILPSYYLADATLTLSRRVLGGERWWQSHRQHFYQRAVRAGASHARVSSLVLVADLALIGLALLSLAHARSALAATVLLVAGLLLLLRRMARGSAAPDAS